MASTGLSEPVEAKGELAVGFTGILFDRPVEVAESAEPSFFADLNLDQVVSAITTDRDEYDLTPFFRVPLHDEAAVAYRHEVFRDLETRPVADAVGAFAGRMRTVREHLARANKLRYRYQKEFWFLDAAREYREAIEAVAAALTDTDLTSRGFTGFREHLSGYAGSAAFTELAADIERVSRALADVQYCVNIRANRVTVSRYEEQADLSADVVATFAKFARGAVKDYRGKFRTWPEMDYVEERITDRVARLFPDEFGALDDFCQRHARLIDQTVRAFDREVQFYTAYLDFITPLKAADLEFCYPQVSSGDKRTAVEAAFDLALAAKLVPDGGAVVRNDLRLTGPERIFVVTGPNHGGKTTFARMTGQLHYLASLGCSVPARQARLFLPDRIFTHFEREEDLATLRGKLADELIRIKDVLDQATGDSLLVMNESFASTTLRDAQFIGERVLDRMTALGLLGVYVTFVDELASRNEACVSMVGTVNPDNPADRTFEIVRKPADGLAYAVAIARKYGLTFPQLKERLAS